MLRLPAQPPHTSTVTRLYAAQFSVTRPRCKTVFCHANLNISPSEHKGHDNTKAAKQRTPRCPAGRSTNAIQTSVTDSKGEAPPPLFFEPNPRSYPATKNPPEIHSTHSEQTQSPLLLLIHQKPCLFEPFGHRRRLHSVNNNIINKTFLFLCHFRNQVAGPTAESKEPRPSTSHRYSSRNAERQTGTQHQEKVWSSMEQMGRLLH